MRLGTLWQRLGIGLWLAVMLADGIVWAQYQYIGPGVIVMRQYRSGGRLYSPNTYSYTYVQPNPFVSGPLAGVRLRPSYPGRVQIPIPTNVGTGTVAPNPYQEYYSPHIPRYYRNEDKTGATETPPVIAPQSSETEDLATREETPGAGRPDRIGQDNAAQPPSPQTEKVERGRPPTGNQTGRPARKPIRYR